MVEVQIKNQNIFWLWSDKIDLIKRSDAYYWLPKFLDIESAVKTGSRLQDLLVKNITYGHTPLGGKNTYTDDGILFIRSGQLNDFFLDLTDNVYISEDVHKGMQRSIVKRRDVLVATVGATIGAVAIVPENIQEANCNQAVGILRADEKKINPYYLAIYLSLPYGNEQIMRQSSGGARDNLDPFELKQVRVIVPNIKDQQGVEILVKKAYQLKKEAEEEYREAVDCLDKTLTDYYDFSIEKRAFIKWSDEINLIEKLHPLSYKKPDKKSGKQFIKMKEYADSLDYGTSQDLEYQNNGIPFLRITDIDEYFQIDLKNLKYISKFDAEKLSTYKVDLDDILISRTGTLGSAILIDKTLKDSIFGSYFIRVKLNTKIKNKLDLDYLVFFINSKIGKLQTASLSSGGIQTNLTITAIENIEIPIIDKIIQERIIKLLKSFKEKRLKSESLLNEAKEFVEVLVKNKKI